MFKFFGIKSDNWMMLAWKMLSTKILRRRQKTPLKFQNFLNSLWRQKKTFFKNLQQDDIHEIFDKNGFSSKI